MIAKHAFQNSLSYSNSAGNNISTLIAGSFLIETIFNIDGLGFESVISRLSMVMGILVVSSILQLMGNLLSDVCLALVDSHNLVRLNVKQVPTVLLDFASFGRFNGLLCSYPTRRYVFVVFR